MQVILYFYVLNSLSLSLQQDYQKEEFSSLIENIESLRNELKIKDTKLTEMKTEIDKMKEQIQRENELNDDQLSMIRKEIWYLAF